MSSIKTELKQCLIHINRALRLAEIMTCDKSIFYSVFVAKDLIEGQTMFGETPKICNDPRLNYGKAGNGGWNPMKSKFPSILRFNQKTYENEQETQEENAGFNFVVFRQKPWSQTEILMKENSNCTFCSLNCDILSQWENRNGQHHAALLADEFLLKKNVNEVSSNKECRFYVKKRKPGNLYPNRFENVEHRISKASWQKMKYSKNEKRRSSRKKQQVPSVTCETCGITCNGKLQYISHINGKRHKKCVEHTY